MPFNSLHTVRLALVSATGAVALGVLTLPAHAGVVALNFGATVSGWQASWDASLDGLVDIHVNLVNSNTIFIEKSAEFRQGPVNGIFPTIPIVFQQVGASAITHIVIDDEIITNSTGSAWTDFHMDLLDSGNAVFNPTLTAQSGGTSPIGFSVAPFTLAAFANNNTTLNISGGVVPTGTQWFPGSGASDGQLWIDVVSTQSGPGTVFTLKETPTPTPGVLALLGLAGLTGRSRRRR